MQTMRDRLLAIISSEIEARKRFKELEDMSGINAESWKAMWHGRQRPTLEMAEAVARNWPDYAYWLACGDTEPELGNIAPPGAELGFLMNARPQEWATKERVYKQKFLRSQQLNGGDIQSARGEFSDSMLESKDDPAAMVCNLLFERIARHVGDTPRPEAGILESDPQLIEIRANRAKALLNSLNMVTVARKNFADSKKLPDFFKRLIAKFIKPTRTEINGDKTD